MCVCVGGGGFTHHFLIGELPSLDAAAVADGLLVPLALGVAEQVHLRGDLRTQTQQSGVTGAEDTMRRTWAGRGQPSPPGGLVKQYATGTQPDPPSPALCTKVTE